MRKFLSLILVIVFVLLILDANAQRDKDKDKPKVDRAIDNMGYWKRMAQEGLVEVAPKSIVPKAIYKGSKIDAKSVTTEDSPDVPVSDTGNDTQSENSIFVSPEDNAVVLNSNNSTSWSGGSVGSVYGASYFVSDDFGDSWTGSVQGAGGSNSGDPAALIDLNGRQYIGFIHSNGGQGVSYSADDGVSWTSVLAGANDGSLCDKNHLWVDNSPSSPYEGNVYDAWTDFGGSNDYNIEFSRSTDGGLSYSSVMNLSSGISGYLHQGVNINSGPNGEVYVIFTIYDNSSLNEDAIGFTKSLDGGQTFSTPIRAVDDTYGIRSAGVSKNHRVNSFPSMAVDISGGAMNGNIYIVWTNVGEPGINTGTNRSVYMIKSEDEGDTWSSAIRVNQGPYENGKEAYFPWITCDPETGTLSVIFYDDRDVNSNQCETWVANSYDGGDTWEDFRVGDVAFTPSPIPGLASSYMGDYLGISARGGMVYPVWPDNRNGYVQTFISPFETNNRAKPTDLQIVLNDGTGETDLTWSYSEAKTLQHFVVYREGVELGTTTETSFADILPDYGLFDYSVTAMHDDGESSPARSSIQWGNPDIAVSPVELIETLLPDQTSTKVLAVTNNGELDLTYNIATAITSKGSSPKAYCSASGGGDEYISGVEFGTISNNGTGEDGYADYTAMSTDVDAGNTYQITVTNGNVYSVDDLGVWVDWNQDEDFDDPGENVVCEVSNGGQGTYDVLVPSDALGGSTRMRVRIKWSGSDCGDPCGSTLYGEVEDYTVNVNSWLNVETTEGSIAPGATEYINVHFNSTDLALGDYFATISVNSNDTDEPQVDVPVTLHVTDDASLNASPSADAYTVCIGSSTTIHANPSGGTGSYTYSWTSNPAGFTSADANPLVSPVEYTVYTVEVDDGDNIITGEVTIDVNDTPGQANVPSGGTEFCQDASNTLYSTDDVADATSYIWSIDPESAGVISGSGTSGNVDWAADFNGTADITVSAVNACGTGVESDALTVTINELPDVNLTEFSDVCIDEAEFALTGGSPAGGTYSGPGVSSGNFDPAVAGIGTHTIIYTYSDGTCENTANETITVNDLPSVTLDPFNIVYDDDPAFELTGGSPAGGVYSGTGVTAGWFDPAVAGIGEHTITYTYEDANGCENYAEENITVEDGVGINELNSGIKFNIYPNPADDILFVDISSVKERELTIKVVNQIGKLVKEVNFASEKRSILEIEISDLSAGIYFLSIQSENVNMNKKVVIR